MCGRFARTEQLDIIAEKYSIEEVYSEAPPDYNITPGNAIPAIISVRDKLMIKDFKWGLVPHRAKDPAIAYKMINARSETVAEKPGFKRAFSTQRCLVIASGFFEWEKRDDGKHPVYIYLSKAPFMALAGLFEKWTGPDGKILETCAIITTPANELLLPIHNRMPVIIDEKDLSIWLDTENHPPEDVLPLLKAYPSEMMKYHYVSKMVNSPKNNSSECIQPLAE